MNTWVQLKDGVAFAHVESTGFVDNAILLEEGMPWENVRVKKYDNGSWLEAPLIYFVTQLVDGKAAQISSTVFSSDAIGDVVGSEVQIGWVRNEDATYSEPEVTEDEAPN